jgi:hypothetical protein
MATLRCAHTRLSAGNCGADKDAQITELLSGVALSVGAASSHSSFATGIATAAAGGNIVAHRFFFR